MGICPIITPLGALHAEITTSQSSDVFSSVSERGKATQWDISGGTVCLSTMPIISQCIPKHRSVDATHAILIRIQAISTTSEVVAKLWLEIDPTIGGPASGECLEALTWTTSTCEVSLGTQDDEYMSFRAAHGLGFPRRFAQLWSENNPVSYLKTGLEIHVPSLQAG